MSVLGDFLIQAGQHLNDRQQARVKRARVREIITEVRSGFPRKPPEAGIAAPVIPPHGPLPMQGGAAAPFDVSD